MKQRSLFADLGRQGGGIAIVVLGAILLSVVAVATSSVLERQATVMWMMMTVVVGLYVFSGTSGVLSFGHAAFMLIGAYTTALLTLRPGQKQMLGLDVPSFVMNADLGIVPAALVAGLVAAVIAFLLSVPLMRLNGLAAALALLAVLIIVQVVAANWEQVTRGTQTILGVPTGTTLTRAAIVGMLAIAAAFAFQSSRTGLRLRASREDPVAAKAVGVNIVRDRRVAFTLSAFIVAVGGSLYAQFLGAFQPNYFYIDITFLMIAMLVIGGMTSLTGAIVGTVTVSVVSEVLRNIEQGVTIGGLQITGRAGMTEVGLALVMLLVLIVRPAGLTGGQELELSQAPPEASPEAGDADSSVQSATPPGDAVDLTRSGA
jgi:branched-chain amino acid transport system permease protein